VKYVKKPIPIEAHQWFKNGDHPEDGDEGEGKVVRYFYDPILKTVGTCTICDEPMSCHGWIKTLEGGHIVCPGDLIITGVQGEHYPIKPDIFEQTYETAPEAPVDMEMSEDPSVKRKFRKGDKVRYSFIPDEVFDVMFVIKNSACLYYELTDNAWFERDLSILELVQEAPEEHVFEGVEVMEIWDGKRSIYYPFDVLGSKSMLKPFHQAQIGGKRCTYTMILRKESSRDAEESL
jgi:hypothetical protein